MLQAAFFSFWRTRNRMILRLHQSNPNLVEWRGATRCCTETLLKKSSRTRLRKKTDVMNGLYSEKFCTQLGYIYLLHAVFPTTDIT
jgi:hypothetical protein